MGAPVGSLDAEYLRISISSSEPVEKYPAKQHAQRVAKCLGVAEGLIYLPGEPQLYLEDSDQPQPFRQRRYFYYLSGVNEPDCHVTYDIRHGVLALWIPKINPDRVIWTGRGSTIEEAEDKYDVDVVYHSDSLQDLTQEWMKHNNGDVYILHPTQAIQPGDDKLPRINYTKLLNAMDEARVIKDDYEIEMIRKANQVSGDAHSKVMKSVSQLKNEAQVEAIFLDVCVSNGAKKQAYEIIAASGENGSTLHYVKNDEPLEGRQMMVLDAGCEWDNYASDVTRTIPLYGGPDGWPSKEAEDIYKLVELIQRTCIAHIKAGKRFLELHYLAHRLTAHGLRKLGIIRGTQEEVLDSGVTLVFFPHGLGHHLGLEVHDVSPLPANGGFDVNDKDLQAMHLKMRKLVSPRVQGNRLLGSTAMQAGMVVTVEPGIYFSRYALAIAVKDPGYAKFINQDVLARYMAVGGVRIEDDILVTERGYENLTTAPKGAKMLELMADRC